MKDLKINLKEDPVRHVEPISRVMTLLSGTIVSLILIATVVALVIIPSPDTADESFLTFLLKNMNITK